MQNVAGKKPFTSIKNKLFHRYSLNILSRFRKEDHSKSEFIWMGRGSLLKSKQKQTGAGECISHSVEIQFKYCLSLQNDLELLSPLIHTAWKVSKYGVISDPYFLVFRSNTEIYEIILRIQSKCRKIQTRNNFVFGHFSHSFRG